jgi:hypothetical protein
MSENISPASRTSLPQTHKHRNTPRKKCTNTDVHKNGSTRIQEVNQSFRLRHDLPAEV